MLIRNPLPRLLAAFLLTAAASVSAAPPEVLTQIPADATGALIVPNLKSLSTNVSNMATRLNLSNRIGIPLPPDLLGFLSRNLGITKGLDPNGSAAFVMLHLGENPMAGPPPLILLLPTTDAAGMMEPFAPAAADAEHVQEVTLPQNNDKGYVAVIDNKFIAFAKDHDVLAGYLKRPDAGKAMTLPAGTEKSVETSDVSLWLNMPELAPLAKNGLANVAEQTSAMMAMTNASQSAFSAALQRHFISIYFDAFQAVVRDSNASLISLRLPDAGPTLLFSASLKPGSPTAQFLAQQMGTTALTLEGLPGNSYLMAAAGNVNGAALVGPVEQFMNSLMTDDDIANAPQAAGLKAVAGSVKELLPLIKGMKMVVLDPPSDSSKGLIQGAALIDTTDPAKYMQLTMEQYQHGDALQELMGGTADVVVHQVATPDALTVKGIKFAKVQVTYKLREETPGKPLAPGAQEALQMIQMMYGPEGLTSYFGIVGKQVLLVMGPDPALIDTAITAAQSHADGLTPAVAKAQVPADAMGVAYLAIGKWVALAAKIAAPQMADQFASAEKAPPLVVSVSAGDNQYTEQVHLPLPALNTFLDLGMELYRTRTVRENSAKPANEMP